MTLRNVSLDKLSNARLFSPPPIDTADTPPPPVLSEAMLAVVVVDDCRLNVVGAVGTGTAAANDTGRESFLEGKIVPKPPFVFAFALPFSMFVTFPREPSGTLPLLRVLLLPRFIFVFTFVVGVDV